MLAKLTQGFLDNRLKKLTETITHIRTLKSLALESTAFEQLNRARQSELVFMQRCVVGAGWVFVGAHAYGRMRGICACVTCRQPQANQPRYV